MMTQQALNKRRSLIVRRQAAYRASRAQHEIWSKRRREPQIDDPDEIGGGEGDMLVDLPDGLLG
jgi:hypothetical protein